MKLLFAFLFLGVVSYSSGISYEGFKLLRVVPTTPSAKDGLLLLSSFSDVSLLTPLRGLGKAVEVLVGPTSYQPFISQMEKHQVPTFIIANDVQKLITEEREVNELAKRKSKITGKMDHSYYRTLDEINVELDGLEAAYPSLFSSSVIGKTYEGRDMRLSKVSADGTDSLPVIWIDCGIHAREWVSPASCLFFLDQLKEYGNDNEITQLLDYHDFYVLSVTNPDGYDFTWSEDRFWRKNRTPYSLCYGTDLNRNFDSDFGGPGTSNQPCADTYHGASAFSELETQAIRDVVTSLGSRVKGFFSLHAFSQFWMTPYGYTQNLPADYNEMMRVTSIGVKALEDVYGTKYTYGNIAHVIYEAAGGSIDWTYDTVGIVYSFALELRDQGQYGFNLPAEQIEPTATEAWAGIKAAINAML